MMGEQRIVPGKLQATFVDFLRDLLPHLKFDSMQEVARLVTGVESKVSAHLMRHEVTKTCSSDKNWEKIAERKGYDLDRALTKLTQRYDELEKAKDKIEALKLEALRTQWDLAEVRQSLKECVQRKARLQAELKEAKGKTEKTADLNDALHKEIDVLRSEERQYEELLGGTLIVQGEDYWFHPPVPTPEDYLAQKEAACHLTQALGTCPPIEEHVLKERFAEGLSLREIGVGLGRCVERVRQIEAKALRRMRHPSRAKKLKEFLNAGLPQKRVGRWE
jgi:RNA polymerase sigma factor (sigma-70 family)